jgi:glycosyltransferase involved in cell wall biosynthesis
MRSIPPLDLFRRYHIAVVIPAYNCERQIEGVLRTLPDYIRTVIVVDDCSRDHTSDVVRTVQADQPRVVLIRHEKNQGVGGAMVTGFRRALELEAQIVVKLDGDGQMSPDNLPELLLPLIRGEADYAKGNRFHDFRALSRMPGLRRFGNMALSFLAKAATGYWKNFDPTNGFLGIRAEALAQLDLDKLDSGYFFEHSMLSHLYLIGAVVRDVPMPARYGEEVSNLSIKRVLWQFPRKLMGCFFRRILLKNFLYDFSMESIYLLVAVPMLLFGLIYGGLHWVWSMQEGVGAPTGTVVIPAMLIILGVQLLLSAIALDLESVPKVPVCGGPLIESPVVEQAPVFHPSRQLQPVG